VLNFAVDGPAHAPVVVLGPSLGTDLHLFDAQVAELAGDWRLVRFDLPGHGGSAAPLRPCTVPSLASDVLALLDHLHVQRFHYVGISLGGAIGQQLALDAADRLLSLAVCASAARFPDPPSWLARAAKVRTEGTAAMVESRTGTWWTPAFEERAPAEAARLLDMLRATSDEGYAACCEAISTFDARPELPRITVPTLVLAGAEDPATPVELVREVADGIPGARFVVLPHAAHLLTAEQPAEASRLLSEHLRRAA